MSNAAALTTLENVEKLPISAIVAYGRRAGIIPPQVASDEAAYGIILKARELGIPVMAAFGEIHVIEGKPTCSARLQLALARRAIGDRLLYEFHGDTEKCTGRMSTDGGHRWQEITITYKEMQAAGYTMRWDKDKKQSVVKNNWKNPAAMLRARVSAALVKICVPEATLGVDTREEMEDVRDLKQIPHTETTAQRLQEQLLGAPPAPPADTTGPVPETPPAAVSEEEPPTEGNVVDADHVPVEDPPPPGEPVEIPKTADWESKIDQAESGEAIAECLRQVAADQNLTKEQKLALRERAVKVSKSKGFKKPSAPRDAGQDG